MNDSKGFTEYEMLSRERLSGLLETITSYRMSKNQCRQILSNAIDLMDERDRLRAAIRKALNDRAPMGGSYNQWFKETQPDAMDEKEDQG